MPELLGLMPKKEFKGNIKTYGKGSNRRPENFRKVQENWDAIQWSNSKNTEKVRRN